MADIKTRERVWVEYSALESIQKQLQLEDKEFAVALGYASASHMKKWRSNNKVPKTTYLAAEGLFRRAGTTVKEEPAVLITLLKNGQVLSSKAWTNLSRANINGGQEYLLVPVPKEFK